LKYLINEKLTASLKNLVRWMELHVPEYSDIYFLEARAALAEAKGLKPEQV